MSKFILIILSLISTSFSYINGPCNDRNGICIEENKCRSIGWKGFSGKCSNNLNNNIKCCDDIPCASEGRQGICVFSDKCKGETINGLCPGGNDFKCCLENNAKEDITLLASNENLFFGPCSGGRGACINSKTVSCETYIILNKCWGGKDAKCCVAGIKPAWYINQRDYTETVTTFGGKDISVRTNGCGIASLTMAIFIATRIKLNPTDLFKEVYDNGFPIQKGMKHDQLVF